MQESMGPVVKRENEHLGSSDAAVMAVRSRLMGEAVVLRDQGMPPGGRDPRAQRVRSLSTVLPKEVSWVDATAEGRVANGAYYSTVGS